MKVIEIADLDDNGVLAVQLPDLLRVLEPCLSTLALHVLELDVILRESTQYNLADVQQKIEASDHGLVLTWAELNGLAAEIFDIQDFILAGCSDGMTPDRRSEFHELCLTCSVIVQCFDSTYWKVCSRDEACVERIAERFNKVTAIELQ